MSRRHIFLIVLAAAAVIAATTGAVDVQAQQHAQRAFTRALITFGVARTLNGVISVAQGTEVAIEPAGVGVNFTVGQILDPVNDLVERFSGVMLIATSSLGLQNVLLRISAWWGVTALLAIAAAWYLITLWRPSWRGGRFESAALKILLVTIFMRFGVALLIIGTSLVFDTFLEAQQAEATAALEATSIEINELSAENDPVTGPDDRSLVEKLGSVLDQSLDAVNVKDRLEAFRDRVANASEHIIYLIVIFVLQTVILPLVMLWLLVEALKFLAARSVPKL